MAELVYAFDLKSNGILHTGSSPVSATKHKQFTLSVHWTKIDLDGEKC